MLVPPRTWLGAIGLGAKFDLNNITTWLIFQNLLQEHDMKNHIK